MKFASQPFNGPFLRTSGKDLSRFMRTQWATERLPPPPSFFFTVDGVGPYLFKLSIKSDIMRNIS